MDHDFESSMPRNPLAKAIITAASANNSGNGKGQPGRGNITTIITTSAATSPSRKIIR